MATTKKKAAPIKFHGVLLLLVVAGVLGLGTFYGVRTIAVRHVHTETPVPLVAAPRPPVRDVARLETEIEVLRKRVDQLQLDVTAEPTINK